MSQTLEETTVGQLVVDQPARARVFEKYGIDYCCGGQQALSLACKNKKLDLSQVLADLRQADIAPGAGETDWAKEPLSDLADHITEHYHNQLRQELPRLDFMTQKVAAVHGMNHPELLELRKVFVEFKNELEEHMESEEKVIFPLIKRLERSGCKTDGPVSGIDSPIAQMIREHDDAGEAMETMRRLTGNYAPPPDACNTYRTLFSAMEEMEAQMHRHVHAENSILFPRVLACEGGGVAASAS